MQQIGAGWLRKQGTKLWGVSVPLSNGTTEQKECSWDESSGDFHWVIIGLYYPPLYHLTGCSTFVSLNISSYIFLLIYVSCLLFLFFSFSVWGDIPSVCWLLQFLSFQVWMYQNSGTFWRDCMADSGIVPHPFLPLRTPVHPLPPQELVKWQFNLLWSI